MAAICVDRHPLASLGSGPVTRFREFATAERQAATESNADLMMGDTERARSGTEAAAY